jgi:autonomous glycyl radical cofactor GrcA|tara:strand:+ start:23 stop:769 length:747 start_codon:yes stop_codon:yes gene_type:complete
MTNRQELVTENKTGIRKNRRIIFELQGEVSTTYADLMLLLADIEEHRSLWQRNFSASFTGNRAIAVDNVNDLYLARLEMTGTLEPKSDVENNFQSMVKNEIEIEQIENSVELNEKLKQICLRMAEVNVIYQSLTGLVAETNEIITEKADTMISENANWVDGALSERMKSSTANSNGQNVASNTDRLQKLKELSHIEKDLAVAVLSRIESETKSILEMGDDIANRRDRIQADRERVTANHRRTADLISK